MIRLRKVQKDALDKRIIKTKRKKRWIRFFGISIFLMVLLLVLFKYLIGIAYYRGESLSPLISDRSCIFYIKQFTDYESNDLIIFEDITETRVLVKNGMDFETKYQKNPTKKINVLGKVVWYFPMEGFD